MRKLLLFSLLSLGVFSSAIAQINCNFTFTADTNNCTYTYSAPAEFANPMLYNIIWTYGNGSGFGSGSPFTAAYNGPTTDVVTMTVLMSDSNLICYSTQTIQICGGGNNNPGCTVVAQNNGVSNTYGFSVPGANYPATWTFPDGTTSSGFQASYTFPGPGMYQVCANITGGGFTCNDCETIYIAEDSSITNPSNCDASFYASTSALTGYFIPYGNTWNNPMGSNLNYTWNFGDGATSTQSYPYHVYNSAGTYNVCLAVDGANCSDTICQAVYIPSNNTFPSDSSCQAYFVVTQQNPFEITVVNGSTSSANSLNTWIVSGGGITFTASGAYPSMVIESTGSYSLCLTVETGNCTSTWCDSILIGADGMMGGRLSELGFTINVTSPQALTGFDVTGIEADAFEFSFYPNPASDVLMISGIDQGRFVVYSIDGKMVNSGNITSQNQIVETSNMQAGIYFISVWNAAGERSVQRIVKH
jgi:PKD repeat protein